MPSKRPLASPTTARKHGVAFGRIELMRIVDDFSVRCTMRCDALSVCRAQEISLDETVASVL